MSDPTPNPVLARDPGALSRCAALAWTESAQAVLVDAAPGGGVRTLLAGLETGKPGQSANIFRFCAEAAGEPVEFHALAELFTKNDDPGGAIRRTLKLPAADGSGTHRKFRTLRSLLLAGPLRKKNSVIVVEEAQWCDESSLRFLDFLLRCGRGDRFLVVLCRRPDEPGPGAWALGQIGAQDRCHRWEVAAPSPVDALACLPAQTRTVATAVAVLDEPDVTRVAALCGLPARSVRIAIDAIRRANLCTGSVLDRSVRSRLLAETPADELARMHLHAARMLNDDARPAAEVAPHLGALPRLDERWMVDLALEAAAAAQDPATAVAHLSRAAAAEPARLDVRLALAAARLGLDPVEIRRINLISPEEIPYRAATRLVHDSRTYGAVLDAALKRLDYEGFRAEQAAARDERNARSRSFAVIAAARSKSRRASSKRPSLKSRSPRTLGNRW